MIGDLVTALADYSNVIIAIVNILLVIFILIQIRDSRKPVIFTKILSRDRDLEERTDVLVIEDQFLAILNRSKNLARSLDISYQIAFDGQLILVREKPLHHLNPDEATKFVLKLQKIREEYPDLFESVTRGLITKSIPKNSLKIELTVKIRYNPALFSWFKYETEDNYHIEWGSLKSYIDYDNHPVIFCWNKRDGEYYIYKLGDRTNEKGDITQEGEDSGW